MQITRNIYLFHAFCQNLPSGGTTGAHLRITMWKIRALRAGRRRRIPAGNFFVSFSTAPRREAECMGEWVE